MQCNGCQGSGALRTGPNSAIACPVCNGSGKDPYSKSARWYETPAIVVAANGAQSGAITITDYDCEVLFLMCVFTDARLTVQITDVTTAYNFVGGLNNQVAHVANVFGTAQNPFVLPVPYKLKANAVVQFNFTDLSGAQNTVFPCLFVLNDLSSRAS